MHRVLHVPTLLSYSTGNDTCWIYDQYVMCSENNRWVVQSILAGLYPRDEQDDQFLQSFFPAIPSFWLVEPNVSPVAYSLLCPRSLKDHCLLLLPPYPSIFAPLPVNTYALAPHGSKITNRFPPKITPFHSSL